MLLKQFGTCVKRLTEEVKAHAKHLAQRTGRPYLFLAETDTKATGTSKEDLTREITEQDAYATAA